MIPKCRIYCYETQEMIVARDYRELAELFLGLDADDGLYSEPMQSTGLFDKNGKEIFERDIVKFHTPQLATIGVVEFDKIEACFKVRNDFGGHYATMFHTRYFEVIGNIYQNPELVEEEPWYTLEDM